MTISLPNVNIVINAPESVNSLDYTSAGGVITGMGSLTTASFTFNALNASFMTNADLTVTFDFTWTTGTLGGTGAAYLMGTSSIDSGLGTLTIAGRDVVNTGGVSWTSGTTSIWRAAR